MRSDERPVGSGQYLVQKPAVLLLGGLVFDEPGLLQVDLIDQLQAAGLRYRPHGAPRRCQGSHHLVEHGVVELSRRNTAARQLGDFVDEPLDLALGALDLFGVHRRGACRARNLRVFGCAHE